jgi:hypothetical protein
MLHQYHQIPPDERAVDVVEDCKKRVGLIRLFFVVCFFFGIHQSTAMTPIPDLF